jgi:DNA-binding transcriptional MerR regulator
MNQRNDNRNTEGLLKISEVASAAGTSVSTVKYYVKEGLIAIACKTGKNMAYYAPECVESVKFIRTLQSEKFFPLAVIKHILMNKAAGAAELELLHTINKADQSDYYERMGLAEAAKEAKLKPREAEALISAGLIIPSMSGHSRMCNHGDCRLMKLVKVRMNAGIPLEQTIKSFSLYESHLKETTKKDIESLLRDCFLTKAFSTEDITNIIVVSDETLDSFIEMKRYAMNASQGIEYIAETEKLLPLLEAFGKGVSAILKSLSYAETADRLDKALAGQETSDRTLAVYSEMLHMEETGLAHALSVLFRTGKYWKDPAPRSESPKMNMVYDALRLGWMTFAPEEFGCEPMKARAEFARDTQYKGFM